MNRFFAVIFFCFNLTGLFAQHQIGVRLDLGVSSISNESDQTAHYEVKPNIAGSIGLTYVFQISEFMGAEADLLITQLNSAQIQTYEGSFQGCIYCTGTTSITRNFSFTYLTLPIYLKLRADRVKFGLGFRTGFRMYDGSTYTQSSTIGGATVKIGPTGSPYGLKPIDFGPALLIDFDLTEKWALGAHGYMGILKKPHNLTGDQFYKFQIGLGATYHFGGARS